MTIWECNGKLYTDLHTANVSNENKYTAEARQAEACIDNMLSELRRLYELGYDLDKFGIELEKRKTELQRKIPQYKSREVIEGLSDPLV